MGGRGWRQVMAKSKRKKWQEIENLKIDNDGKIVEVKPEEPKRKKPLIIQSSHRR